MKRRWMRAAVVLLLVTITLLLPLLVASHRIDEAHRELIREGMTLADVESIFGVPAGTYDWAVLDESQAARYVAYRALHFLARMQAADATEVKETRHYAPATALRVKLRLMAHGGLPTKTWTSRHGSATIGFEGDRVGWIGDWQTTHVEPPWERWWKKCFGK